MGKRLWVERNKDGSWDAFSDDGAHIKFGKGKGQFSPGDLMKIAPGRLRGALQPVRHRAHAGRGQGRAHRGRRHLR